MKLVWLLSILFVVSCSSTEEKPSDDMEATRTRVEVGDVSSANTWDSLWGKYFARNDENSQNKYEESEHLYRITVKHDDSFVLFTKNSHPAHPSFARIYLNRENGGLKVRTTGFTWGDESSYEKFMLEEIVPFSKELAKLVQQSISKKVKK